MEKQKLLKSLFVLLFVLLPFAVQAVEKERLIYSTTFQDWETAASSATSNVITKATQFSNETLNFSLLGVSVSPSGTNSKFTSAVCTPGYLMMEKNTTTGFTGVDMSVELSPLKSITTLSFVVAATGSSRGVIVSKKVGTGDWSVIYNTAANPAGGQLVEIPVNEKDVAIKFTNLAPSQNAYLLSLDIKGNVEVTSEQVTLTTEVSPVDAGILTVNPQGTEFDKNTVVALTATPNFGYKFSKWVDSATGTDLSTDNPFNYTLAASSTVKAVFDAKQTYSFSVNILGDTQGRVTVTPAATGGKYEAGTAITLTAESNDLIKFNNWDDASTNAVKTITIDADTQISATFSAVSYIVGWDFYTTEPKQDRAGDFKSETSNAGIFKLQKADETSIGWLAKGDAQYHYSKHAAVNWQKPTDKYYFQASFSTVNYTNILVKAKLLSCYYGNKVENIEYSLDGTTFIKLGSITFDAQQVWYDSSVTLPTDANGKDKVYIRWIPDYTSEVVNGTQTSDGASITDIFVFADKEFVNDTIAPTLISSLPVNNGTGASATGSVILNFNERVQAGTGDCTLNSEAIAGTYGSSTVIFKYSGLSYDTSYTFTVPDGAIKDMNGNPFAGITITFKTMQKVQPAAKLYNAVVAADGSGDYTTVSDAVKAAPSANAVPWLIFIKEGTYTGHVAIDKPNIYLIGQDRDKVFISDNLLCGGTTAVDVKVGSTVYVSGDNFYAENITFDNSWGVTQNAGPQALALFTDGDKAILNNCALRSYQDTYRTSTSGIKDRHYVRNCFIEGAVDFIYGAGDVFFDACTLNIVRESGGYIVAPSHNASTAWGYVFNNCTITAPTDKIASTTIYLGRPWIDSPKTVYLNTTSLINIYPSGWYYKMGTIPAIFADYNTMDKYGNKMDLSSRIKDYEYDIKDASGNVTSTVKGTAKNSLTDAEAATYTLKNVMSGSDDWQPTLITESVAAPVIAGNLQTISWSKVNYAICYVITKNNKVVKFTTDLTYTDNAAANGDIYSVQAANEYGGLSPVSNTYAAVITGLDNIDKSGISVLAVQGAVNVSGIDGDAIVSIYSMNGSLLKSAKVTGSTSISLDKGTYVVKVVSDHATKKTVVLVR